MGMGSGPGKSPRTLGPLSARVQSGWQAVGGGGSTAHGPGAWGLSGPIGAAGLTGLPAIPTKHLLCARIPPALRRRGGQKGPHRSSLASSPALPPTLSGYRAGTRGKGSLSISSDAERDLL